MVDVILNTGGSILFYPIMGIKAIRPIRLTKTLTLVQMMSLSKPVVPTRIILTSVTNGLSAIIFIEASPPRVALAMHSYLHSSLQHTILPPFLNIRSLWGSG